MLVKRAIFDPSALICSTTWPVCRSTIFRAPAPTQSFAACSATCRLVAWTPLLPTVEAALAIRSETSCLKAASTAARAAPPRQPFPPLLGRPSQLPHWRLLRQPFLLHQQLCHQECVI